jgi:hypothetical protein
MKKQFAYSIQKKVFAFLVALVIVFSSSVSLYAVPNPRLPELKQAQVTYKGLQDKFLVFHVDYKNELAQDFILTIRDDHHQVLFSKKYEPTGLSTDILLSDLPEDCKLTFAIRTGKKEFSQAFEINNRVKVVSEYEVKGI